MIWKGQFGDAYTERNADPRLEARKALFSKVLAPDMRSITELGCNTGPNLRAIHALDPSIKLTGYEVNGIAAAEAFSLGLANIHCCDVLATDIFEQSDLALTSGVLIHIAPEDLPRAYQALMRMTRKYVLLCEYYNPSPTTVPWRGTLLYKRDFAGELMDRFSLTLRDYGFVYHRDENPMDDMTWFLLEKPGG